MGCLLTPCGPANSLGENILYDGLRGDEVASEWRKEAVG